MNQILIAFALFLTLVLSNSAVVFAQTTSANKQQKAIERKEMEMFLNKFFADQMPKYKVPGAVFVVVKDGKVFFAKGLGYADVEKKKPVDSNKTLFRAYSISKSFTATAVMSSVISISCSLFPNTMRDFSYL